MRGMRRARIGGVVCSPSIVEIPTKVVPASAMALLKFKHADLKAYAKSLGIQSHSRKIDTVIELMRSCKATLCASLGT